MDCPKGQDPCMERNSMKKSSKRWIYFDDYPGQLQRLGRIVKREELGKRGEWSRMLALLEPPGYFSWLVELARIQELLKICTVVRFGQSADTSIPLEEIQHSASGYGTTSEQ